MERSFFAIGDIHGRDDLLGALLAEIDGYCIEKGVEHPTLVFLGDYIDRGPQSAQVVDRLIDLKDQRDCIFLKGNHEEVVLQILGGVDAALQPWITRAGGLETILSYGWRGGPVELASLLPDNHVRFFQDLLPCWATDHCIFVHAGLRPGRSLAEQSPRDMLWIRDEFLESDHDFGRLVVHGHTPSKSGTPDHRPNRLNLDTKAYRSGILSCAAFEPGSRAPRFLNVSIEAALPRISV